MHTDAHFERGRTHAVCQDYALCGTGRAGSWAVVCDGCSSSPHTDTGARLLAHAAAAVLRDGRLPGSHAVWHAAAAAAVELGLAPCSLDATLVAALALDDAVVAIIRGDGVVAARRRDGGVEVVVRRCRDETPDYPGVVVDPARRRAWLELVSPRAWLEHVDDGVAWSQAAHAHTWVARFDRDHYDRLLLATDGLATLRGRGDGEPFDVATAAARMMAAPSTTGCFVRRRLGRLGRADGPFGDALPDDDLAVAAMAWDGG